MLSPDENRPPQAHAGGDRVVLLPVKLVVLDGSASSDDQGIKSYLWSRDRHSLGAGVSAFLDVFNSIYMYKEISLILLWGRWVKISEALFIFEISSMHKIHEIICSLKHL